MRKRHPPERRARAEREMDKYLETNKRNWNERVGIHKKSESYDVKGFLNGNNPLQDPELEELGDVSGLKILHLQCHFGRDTLSLARMGAEVTGVDFSEEAIALAKELSQKINVQSRFICCNVLELDNHLDDSFDVVYASYGVFCWIPDLNRWFEIAAKFLKPGGRLIILDDHPVSNVYEYNDEKNILEIAYPYFNRGPLKFVEDYTYTGDTDKMKNNVKYEWSHSVSDFFSAAFSNGLNIRSFKEYTFSVYCKFPNMKKNDAGNWTMEGTDLPLMFSMVCEKVPAALFL